MPAVTVETPAGLWLLTEENGYLTGSRPADSPVSEEMTPILERAAAAVRDYFRGIPLPCDIPLDTGGTALERKVWEALRRIPWGEERTYGEIARAIGQPGAARAVGHACGRNPLLLFVPCHRVRAAGGPGGFAYGIQLKIQLLITEKEKSHDDDPHGKWASGT